MICRGEELPSAFCPDERLAPRLFRGLVPEGFVEPGSLSGFSCRMYDKNGEVAPRVSKMERNGPLDTFVHCLTEAEFLWPCMGKVVVMRRSDGLASMHACIRLRYKNTQHESTNV